MPPPLQAATGTWIRETRGKVTARGTPVMRGGSEGRQGCREGWVASWYAGSGRKNGRKVTRRQVRGGTGGMSRGGGQQEVRAGSRR